MKRSDLIDVIQNADHAIRNVLANWERGDLASAIRELQEVHSRDIQPALTWWENDE